MAEQDEFFVPDDIDRQIERLRQSREGDRRDAEAMEFLRGYYQTDAKQEQEALNRMWSRIAGPRHFAQNTQTSEKELPMYHPDIHSQAGTLNSSHQSPPRRGGFRRRLNLLAAIVLLVVLVGSLTIVFAALRNRPGGSASPATGVPLSVTSVSMSVTPGSIAGLACGTNVTVTYTALFHVRPNSVGGTVRFTYTTNNGRGSTPASITFNPGETSKSYSFTWSGALPTDHTAPGPGGVQVTSPNQLTSQMVAPAGQCTAGAFQVTSVTMAVNPASIQGMACGTSITVTYIATLHVAANSPGGTVQFTYTTNNGRSSTQASITFSPGQTSRTYSFTWSGALPADHTYPGLGGIQVTAPNQLTSQMVKPGGQCS